MIFAQFSSTVRALVKSCRYRAGLSVLAALWTRRLLKHNTSGCEEKSLPATCYHKQGSGISGERLKRVFASQVSMIVGGKSRRLFAGNFCGIIRINQKILRRRRVLWDSGGLGTIAMDLFTLNELSLCFFSVRPSDQQVVALDSGKNAWIALYSQDGKPILSL
jgi:hypothetical protein